MSLLSADDIVFSLLHMSDVVIGKPLSHCLASHPDKKMVGVRTDAATSTLKQLDGEN